MAIELDDLTVTIDLDERIPSSEVELVVDEIIRFIQTRTISGRDVNGVKFEAYSEEGKKSGTPDLYETGSMLERLDIISISDKTVTIGYDSDESTDSLKAFNHNTGDTLPLRQFIGITASDLKKIQRRFING